MATSADKDDHDDEKDDPTDGEDVEEKAEAKPAEKKPAEKKPAEKKPAEKKPAAKDEDDDEDEEDEDAEEEEAKPAAKPATAAKPGAKPAVPAKPGAKPAVAKRPGARPGAKPKAATPPPKGSFGKSLILFVVVFGGLAAAFAFLGREEPRPGKPKWTVGQVVDVELTLVKTDKDDLFCASPDDVGGKHCAFEGQSKPRSKADTADDTKLLRPYTTTDGVQLLAAGVWSAPGLSPDKIPPLRFPLKCKYKVDAIVKKVDVRWHSTDAWLSNSDWYAGAVSDCKVSQ